MSNYLPPMALIAIGALCSLLGGFWLTRVQALERQKSSEARAAFEKELRSKSEKIAQLNETIASTITGGDNWCYLLPLRPATRPAGVKRKSTRFDLLLLHEGTFPLYDVAVRVEDPNRMVKAVRAAWERGEWGNSTMTEAQAMMGRGVVAAFRLGNLAPKTAVPLGPIAFAKGDSQTYLINIVARNGSLFEIVRWERVNDQRKLAFRVARGEETLKEHVDEGFPIPEGKTAPW